MLCFLFARRHLFHAPSHLKSQHSEKVKASCTSTAAWESYVSTRDTPADPDNSTGDWWVYFGKWSYNSYAEHLENVLKLCFYHSLLQMWYRMKLENFTDFFAIWTAKDFLGLQLWPSRILQLLLSYDQCVLWCLILKLYFHIIVLSSHTSLKPL